MKDDDFKKLKKVLLKKALGYVTSEQVCEYTIDPSGEPVLSKKKITKKQVSPDLAAVKILLENDEHTIPLAQMSDEQLLLERDRLKQLIREEEDADRKMQQTDEV